MKLSTAITLLTGIFLISLFNIIYAAWMGTPSHEVIYTIGAEIGGLMIYPLTTTFLIEVLKLARK